MAKTKAESQAYIDEWQKQNVDRVTVKIRKDTGILSVIDRLVKEGRTASRQAFIIQAIIEKFSNDYDIHFH